MLWRPPIFVGSPPSFRCCCCCCRDYYESQKEDGGEWWSKHEREPFLERLCHRLSLSLSLTLLALMNVPGKMLFFVECRLEWWWTSNLVHELRQEFVGLRFSDFFFSFCTFLDAGRTFLVVFDVSESNSSPSSSLFGKRGKEATFRLIVAAITAMHSLVLSRPLPPHSAPAIRRFLGRRR